MPDSTKAHHETVREEEVATTSDAAFFWNDVLLDALLVDDQKPKPQREQGGVTRASRAAAIVHAAIHDAVNGVNRRFAPYLIQDRAPAGASIEAAAAGAAHATLSGLYPSQRTQGAKFDDKLDEFLKPIPDPGRVLGAQFGRMVGNALLLARQHDGRNQSDPPYLEKPTPGEWRRDPIAPLADQIPPLTPGWGSIRPFILDYGPQFRPVPYPLLTSGEYRAAFDEVRREGDAEAHKPPTEKTEIALFWSYDDQLGTPIRLYNQNVREILTQRPRPATPPTTILHVHARILALVNLAMADAGIGCWDAKFAYDLWRPVEGIRRANEDNNPNTTPDPNWKPLGRPRGPGPNTTPPFPAYPSGHSSFGTATFAMLRKVYGSDNVSFTLTSEERPNGRNYTTFTRAIAENGQSRIYLGVHWQFDNTRGQALGQRVADETFNNFLRPLG